MKIAISGASGFLGKELGAYYENLGFDVVRLSRKHFRSNIHDFKEHLRGVDVLIHLSGAVIFKRWTSSYRKELYASRLGTLEKLHTALKLIKERPKLILAASAVGLYSKDDHRHTEEVHVVGDDFLGQLVKAWEEKANELNELENMRVVNLRFGVVLGRKAAAFRKLILPFKLGVGGKLGTGNQPFSFIHVDDVKDITMFFIQRKDLSGPFNLVAPEIVSNKEFAQKIGHILRRPSFLPVPRWALWLLKGKASTILTKGSKVYPNRLLQEGYEFKYPTSDGTLEDLLRK